ncbi:Uncharacterized protein APZ42_017629 [Daphnia magna]|uniref:Uncharacterized protein n=1 Tax=Daphnia magna TaxID=35525 RepID=A0A0P6BNX0_9CRUS|nr:Uncharacterized protein APZ42_017629 [Daphnia magna]
MSSRYRMNALPKTERIDAMCVNLTKSNRHGFNCSAFTLRRILTRCKSLEYRRFHI